MVIIRPRYIRIFVRELDCKVGTLEDKAILYSEKQKENFI